MLDVRVVAPVLSKTPLFGRISSRADMAHLERVAAREVVAAGAILAEEGRRLDSIDLILKGEVSVCFGTAMTESLRLGPGSLFGEMEFFEKSVGLASVIARRTTELVRVPIEELTSVAHDNPLTGMQLYHGFLNTMVSKHRLVTDTLVDTKLNSCRQQVAHDLRSPLSALRHLVAGAQGMSAQEHGLAEQIIARIACIISDLGSKERGAVAALCTKNFLGALLDIISEKRTQYDNRQHLVISGNVPERLTHFDPGAASEELLTVVSNLLDNAVEATPPAGGTVTLDVSETPQHFTLWVRDRGSGIDAGRLSSLGTQPVRSCKKGGRGIGLFHATRRVEGLGGRMVFSSDKKQGTSVGFTFPAHRLSPGPSVRLHLSPNTLVERTGER